jgi:thymidine kinase
MSGYLELVIGPMFSGKTSKLLEVYKQCEFCGIPVVIVNHSIDTRYDYLLENQPLEKVESNQGTIPLPNFAPHGGSLREPNCDSTFSKGGSNVVTMLSSHDKVTAPCIRATTLEEALKTTLCRDADVILINEGQFFGDLYEGVQALLQENKQVYVCGLDGDFERKPIGTILNLIPLCDKVTKLTSLCSICRNGTPGIFSMRLTEEKNQILVGVDNYVPVCRMCYERKR